MTRKKPVQLWSDLLQDAHTYEEWEEAAFQLDVLLGNDLWSVHLQILFTCGEQKLIEQPLQAPEPYI